jgi:hypothetical protein
MQPRDVIPMHQASKADTPCLPSRSKGESHSYRRRPSLTLIRPHLTSLAWQIPNTTTYVYLTRTYGRTPILVLLELQNASIVRSRSTPHATAHSLTMVFSRYSWPLIHWTICDLEIDPMSVLP